MLDLNIDAAVSVDSACDETDPNPILKTAPSTFLADDSGASSSVVNALVADDEESNSSSGIPTHTTLKFSILNNSAATDDVNQIIRIVDDDDDDDRVLMTRPLFPVPTNDSFSTARPHQWLKLSPSDAAVGEVEIGIYNKGQQPAPPPPPPPPPAVKKSRRGPRSRSSEYRGVTFYRRTGRWESHIWDCGKQVYLGGFDTAQAAARAYDQAAIKFRGVDADINFHISDYEEDMKPMKNLTKEEFIQILRRQSAGFSRGRSKCRGVTLHKSGRWEAQMGQFLGQKYIYLGLFDSKVEAVRAYDKAAIKCNGRNAVTNFGCSAYKGEIGMVGKDEGGGDNIDLNLWISPASDGLKEIGDPKSSQTHYLASELPNGKRLKVESSFDAPDGLAMPMKDSSAWIRSFYGFGPNNEERARKMRAEGIPLPGLSNWPWKMQGNGVITSVPLFPSAASSGFSTTTTYSTALVSSNTQNKSVDASAFQQPPMAL